MTTDPPFVVFHAGVHKTGTTLIQNTLNSHRIKLAIHGVRYIPRARVAKALGFGDREGATAMRFPHAWRTGRLWPRIVLLSHERLIGRFQDFYAESAKRANLLFAASQGHDARVIIYIKRQDRFIESCYVQTLQMGSSKTFQQFLESHPQLRQPLWTKVVNPLSDVFGFANVRVVPAESISVGPQAYIDQFIAHICPRLSGLRLRPSKRSNLSYTMAACRIAQFANPMLDRSERRRLRHFLQEHLHSERRSPPFSFFSKHERCELLKACQEDNRALFDRYLPSYDRSLYAAPSQ